MASLLSIEDLEQELAYVREQNQKLLHELSDRERLRSHASEGRRHLADALIRYGSHRPGCAGAATCTCGFQHALDLAHEQLVRFEQGWKGEDP